VVLCEVKVFAPDATEYDLKKVGAVASQSSDESDRWHTNAANSIDGNGNGRKWLHTTCSHTGTATGDLSPWLQVAIPGDLPIGHVVIHPRSTDPGQIIGAKVLLDNVLMGSMLTNQGLTTFEP
jgi:hypothetical protein